MQEQPAYRVSSSRALLRALERHHPEEARRVVAALPEDVLAVVRDALPLAWMSAKQHHELADRAFAELGPVRYRALWRGLLLEMTQTPLLKTFTQSAMRLFGATPSGLARWTSRGYTLTGRGLGTLTLVHDDPVARRVVLELEGYPAELSASGASVTGMAGSFEGFLDLTRKTGEVIVSDVIPARGHARFEIRWDP